MKAAAFSEPVSSTRVNIVGPDVCFIWATSTDELVPVQHALLMAQALSAVHIPYELHIFEQGQHGLSLADQASAASLSQCSADVAAWAGLAGTWLHKRFALPLPEKTDWELMMEPSSRSTVTD